LTGQLKKLLPYLLTASLLAVFFVIAALVSRPRQQTQAQVKQWYTMDEAQLKASSNHKKVLVQIYARNCDLCEDMSRRIYESDSVSNALHRFFYPVKINGHSNRTLLYNGQKMTQTKFVRSLGISEYPASVFIASDGEIISQQGGYIKPGLFTKLLYYIGSNAYQRMEFDQYTVKRNKGRR